MKYFVHRFKWSHDSKRKEFKKKLKKGSVKIIERNRDGWLYQDSNPSTDHQ